MDEMQEAAADDNVAPARKPRRDWGLWLQVVPGVVGMFIGVLALYAALSEAEAVRKQQQAAVWPYVELTAEQHGLPGERNIELLVTNKGIGPARILYFDVSVDGEASATWQDVFFSLFANDKDADVNLRVVTSDKGVTNTVLSPEERVQFFYISQQDANRLAELQDEAEAQRTRDYQLRAIDKLLDGLVTDRVIFHACYCSVFDDCWEVKSNSRDRKKVEACPTPQFDPAM